MVADQLHHRVALMRDPTYGALMHSDQSSKLDENSLSNLGDRVEVPQHQRHPLFLTGRPEVGPFEATVDEACTSRVARLHRRALPPEVVLLAPVALVVHLAKAAEVSATLDRRGLLRFRRECEQRVRGGEHSRGERGIDRSLEREPAGLAKRAVDASRVKRVRT